MYKNGRIELINDELKLAFYEPNGIKKVATLYLDLSKSRNYAEELIQEAINFINDGDSFRVDIGDSIELAYTYGYMSVSNKQEYDEIQVPKMQFIKALLDCIKNNIKQWIDIYLDNQLITDEEEKLLTLCGKLNHLIEKNSNKLRVKDNLIDFSNFEKLYQNETISFNIGKIDRVLLNNSLIYESQCSSSNFITLRNYQHESKEIIDKLKSIGVV